MIREGLEAESRHAMMVVTPSNSCSFERREVAAGILYVDDIGFGHPAAK
jgi:hypothetical protein